MYHVEVIPSQIVPHVALILPCAMETVFGRKAIVSVNPVMSLLNIVFVKGELLVHLNKSVDLMENVESQKHVRILH